MSENQDMVYQVKQVHFKGLSAKILLQNVNGPCPLLALLNVLLLRGEIKLGVRQEFIRHSDVLLLLANYILSLEKPAAVHQDAWNQSVQDSISLLPSLANGLDVNVYFHSCTAFEFTQQTSLFDLLGVHLLHGWVYNKEDTILSEAIGQLSYNQVIEQIIQYHQLQDSLSSALSPDKEENSCPPKETDSVFESRTETLNMTPDTGHNGALVPKNHTKDGNVTLDQESHSQISEASQQLPHNSQLSQDVKSDGSLSFEEINIQEGECVQPANLHKSQEPMDFIPNSHENSLEHSHEPVTEYVLDFVDVRKSVDDMTLESTLITEEDAKDKHEYGSSLEPKAQQSATAVRKQPSEEEAAEPSQFLVESKAQDDLSNTEENLVHELGDKKEAKYTDEQIAKIVYRGIALEDFLERTSSQLTRHGIKDLGNTIREGQLCVFFRNNHFSVLHKHNGNMYILVTDQGFLAHHMVIWEKLDEVSGNTSYYDGYFVKYDAGARSRRDGHHSGAEETDAGDIGISFSREQIEEQQRAFELLRQSQQQEHDSSHNPYANRRAPEHREQRPELYNPTARGAPYETQRQSRDARSQLPERSGLCGMETHPAQNQAASLPHHEPQSPRARNARPAEHASSQGQSQGPHGGRIHHQGHGHHGANRGEEASSLPRKAPERKTDNVCILS